MSFYTGDGSYGDKTVEDVAIDLIAASQQNLFRFETPRIVFAFFDGVTKTVAGERVLTQLQYGIESFPLLIIATLE